MTTHRAIRPVSTLGLSACLGAEIVAGILGFVGTIHLARRLEPRGFATLEIASAAAGWMLVLVRGGLDQIILREAVRHPRLIGRLTRHLIELRLVWALIGFGIMAALSLWLQNPVLLAGGLILFPSALVNDVGPRARNELGFLAMAQLIRSVGMLSALIWFVSRPDNLIYAALVPALAESLVALVYFYRTLPRLNRTLTGLLLTQTSFRAVIVLSKRAAVAGLTRFFRVGLYAADALALTLISEVNLGGYAAGRRVVFALVAVGIIVPSLLGPGLARAKGWDAISLEVGRGVSRLLGLFVPAALGLILIADRGLPYVFGADYQIGSLLLILIAVRLPTLLVATWFHSALIALGRETTALWLTTWVSIAALIAVPIAAIAGGATGIAASTLGIELISALGGYLLLTKLGVVPGRSVELGPWIVGCLAMIVGVSLTARWPLMLTILAGALCYGTACGFVMTCFKQIRMMDRIGHVSIGGPTR